MIAGELTLAVGHEGHLVRPVSSHKIHQLVKRIAFNVEFPVWPTLHQVGQVKHVGGTNVTLIGAGVNGNALSTRFQTHLSRFQDTGNTQVA